MILEGHPAEAIIKFANPVQNDVALFGTTLLNRELWPEAFWNMEFVNGKLTALWPIPPLPMKITKVVKGVPTEYGYATGDGKIIRFPADEIVWMPNTGPGNWLSTSAPMDAARQVIQTDLSSIRQQETFFERGHHAFALTTDQVLQPSTVDQLRAQWTEGYKGLGHFFKPAILHSGLKTTDIGRGPGSEVMDLRGQLREDILAVFGVPPAIVGAFDEKFGVTIREQKKLFWEEALMPRLESIAADVTDQLVLRIDDAAEFFWQWDLVPALRPDISAILPALNTATGGPVLMVDEAREFLGKEPLPDDMGQVWYLSMNQIPEGPGATSSEPAEPEEQEIETEPEAEEEEEIEPEEEPEKRGGWLVMKGLRRMGPELRANRYKAFNTERLRQEKQLRSQLAPIFDDLADLIIAKLQELKSGLQPGRVKDPRVDALLFEAADAGAAFEDVVLPFLNDLAARTGQEAIASTGLGITFNPDTTRMQELLKGRRRYMQSVGEKVQSTARTALAEGLAKGETVKDLTKRVEAWAANGKERYAQAVARTEVGSAMNAASMEGYRQSGATHKEWLSIVDDRTRGGDAEDLTNHIELDGEIVPLEGKFELEGPIGLEYADRPMDPDLSAANVVNCRCTSAAVFSEEA
jgi:phage portal protein BeeE